MMSEGSFTDFYQAHLQFALARARGMGVDDAGVEDVVQHVFWVAARRFDQYRSEDARSSAKAWVMAILRRVVSEHRRSTRRKSPHVHARRADPETLPDSRDAGPHETLVRIEAVQLVRRMIEGLEEDKREAFVLAELEHLTVSEIAAALGLNANTVASRVRAARRDLERAVLRCRLQEIR
jgi:RNA polymerase sigma-70 factor (ECF subfamily)